MKRIISILSIIIIVTLTVLPLCLGVSAAPSNNRVDDPIYYIVLKGDAYNEENYIPVYYVEDPSTITYSTVGFFQSVLGSASELDGALQFDGYVSVELLNGNRFEYRTDSWREEVTFIYYYTINGVEKSRIIYTFTGSITADSNWDIYFYVNSQGELMGKVKMANSYNCDIFMGNVFNPGFTPSNFYGDGFDEGFNSNDSYQEGYDDGYDIGLEEGYTNGYQVGYHNGIIEAGNENTENAYGEGFAAGRDQGFIEGQQVENITFNAILGFFQGLTNFFEPFFRVGIGSITVSSLLGITLVVSIGAIIIKILRG